MPIKLIIAGLPRTGTTSVCDALKLLGYEKTMHMDACIADPRLMAAWQEIYAHHLEKVWTSQDWRDFFDKRFPGYVAGIDCPFADFAVEISRAYPEAKVILQHRDPEKWFVSCQRLFKEASFSRWDAFCIRPLSGIYALHQLMTDRLRWWRDVYDYPNADRKIMLFYINKIKSSISPERLLVYKVQDGWEPLCRFLEQEIPAKPFPKLNDARASADTHSGWKNEGLDIWAKRFEHVMLTIFVIMIIIVLNY